MAKQMAVIKEIHRQAGEYVKVICEAKERKDKATAYFYGKRLNIFTAMCQSGKEYGNVWKDFVGNVDKIMGRN